MSLVLNPILAEASNNCVVLLIGSFKGNQSGDRKVLQETRSGKNGPGPFEDLAVGRWNEAILAT